MNILRHGLDTVHYHVRISLEDVQACIKKCDEWLAQGAEFVQDRGINGYGYTITFDYGLRVFVPSIKSVEAGVNMGLYIIGGATFCLSYEPLQYESVIDGHVFSRLGLRVEMSAYRLRRADLCFDVANGRPYLNEDQIVSRARHRAVYHEGSQFTGIVIGKDKIRFRAYDKLVEAEAHGTLDRWREVWQSDSDEIWRYEYQLRGDFLVEFGIESMQDLSERQADVLEYLFTWLRFAEPQPRKDVDRPLLLWWQQFVNMVRLLPLSSIGAVRRLLPKRPNVKRLADQLVGLTSSWAAALAFLHEREYEYEEMVNELICLVDVSRDKLRDSFRAKLVRYRQDAFA